MPRYANAAMVPGSEVTAFLRLLKKVKKGRSGWVANCPAHDDARASLSVREGDNGRLLVHCFAGCTFSAILEAAGFPRGMARHSSEVVQLMPTGRSGIVKEYDYCDESDSLLYQVVRYDSKDFRQRRPDGAGGWIWNLQGVRRVPYRLSELIEGAALGMPVYVAEGEKDVDNLSRLGVVATTNSGGAGKWEAGFAQYFGGASRVVVLADNDFPGQQHAFEVAMSAVSVVSDVRLVRLPGLSPKGDPSDWIAGGGDLKALYSLADEAPRFTGAEPPPQLEPLTSSLVASPDPQVFSLRALLERPELLAPPTAIIPPIAREGRITLLSGREKSGKSTLLACAVAEYSRGGQFLGQPLSRGKTLWLTLDEGLNDTVRRFERLGADPDYLSIAFERPDPDQLRRMLSREKPSMLVVDTLTELIPSANFNKPETFLEELREYIAAIRCASTACAMSYHASKSRGEFIGDVRLGGAVDAVLTLLEPSKGKAGEAPDAEETDDGRRVLKGKTRWGERIFVRLGFDGVRYQVGDAPMPLSEQIWRVLDEHGELSSNDIVARTTGKRTDILEALRTSVASGHVLQARRGAYAAVPRITHGNQLSDSGKSMGTIGEPERNHSGTEREPTRFPDADSGVSE